VPEVPAPVPPVVPPTPPAFPEVPASHDIAPVSGSTMAYLDYSVGCNDINEIDPSGTTKKIFTASSTFGNMCHANALRYSEAEDEHTFSVVDTDVIRVSRTNRCTDPILKVSSAGGRDAAFAPKLRSLAGW
jgi:hypothetical protein